MNYQFIIWIWKSIFYCMKFEFEFLINLNLNNRLLFCQFQLWRLNVNFVVATRRLIIFRFFVKFDPGCQKRQKRQVFLSLTFPVTCIVACWWCRGSNCSWDTSRLPLLHSVDPYRLLQKEQCSTPKFNTMEAQDNFTIALVNTSSIKEVIVMGIQVNTISFGTLVNARSHSLRVNRSRGRHWPSIRLWTRSSRGLFRELRLSSRPLPPLPLLIALVARQSIWSLSSLRATWLITTAPLSLRVACLITTTPLRSDLMML